MALDNFRRIDMQINRANDYQLETQFAKEGDYNGRELVVQITNAGEVSDQTGVSLNLGWKHDYAGNSGLDNFTAIDAPKGIFRITYPTEMLIAGDVTATIQVIENGKITLTRNFKITVENSPIDEGAIVSENSFTALQNALKTVNQYDGRLSNLELSKADKSNTVTQSEFDSWVATLLDGGPSIFMNTLSELQSTYPNGAAGVALVRETDPAKIYVWNGEAWEDFGTYQGIEIKDGAVTTEKLASYSVTRDKANFGGFIPKGMIFERRADNQIRAYNVSLTVGDILKIKSGWRISMQKVNSDGTKVDYFAGWVKDDVVIDASAKFDVWMSKVDLASISNAELLEATNYIAILNGEVAIRRSEARNFLSKKYVKYIKTSSASVVRSTVFEIEKDSLILIDESIELALYLANGTPALSGWHNKIIVESTDNYYLHISKKDRTDFTDNDIANLVNLISVITPNDLVSYQNLDILNNNKTLYVSYDGSDSNDGLSETSPIKTIQKAVDMGASTIYAKSGDYVGQTLNVDGIDDFKLYGVSGGAADDLTKENKTVRLINARQLSNLTYIQGRFNGTIALDTNDYWKEVFTDKTLPIEIAGAYVTNDKMRTYNAVLWQVDNDNDANTTRLRPVLSSAELVAGTFYYDGTQVHIFPSIDKTTLKFYKGLDRTLQTPRFENVGKLEVSDVDFLFQNGAVEVDNVPDYQFKHCDFSFSTEYSGFHPSNTNGVTIKSRAKYNQRDGFGPTGRGNMDFTDCEGAFNADDGISHHSNTTGVISGGEYHHNVKGGVIPTQNTKVDCYNVISHDNKYGFNHRDGYGQTIKQVGCVAYNNEIGISVGNFKVLSFGCSYENNTNPIEEDVNELTKLTRL